MEYQDNEHIKDIAMKNAALSVLMGRLGMCNDYWTRESLIEELRELLEEILNER